MARIYISIVIFTLAALAAVPSQAQENRYGVIIANKDYNNVRDLEFAQNDFEAAKNLFLNVFGIPKRNLIVYKNNGTIGSFKLVFGSPKQPVKDTGIYKKINQRHKNAELFVYLIGHGIPVQSQDSKKSEGYFMLQDSVASDANSLRQTAYSTKTLFNQLERIKELRFPNGKVTIFIESCFSGKSDSLDAAKAGPLVEGVSAPGFGPPELVAPDSLRVITAARSDQFAVWDKKYEHSVFTRAVVMGLFGEADRKENDGDENGKVTAGEFRNYLERVVAIRARRNKNVAQIPEMTGFKDGDVLAHTNVNRRWEKAIEWHEDEKHTALELFHNKDATKKEVTNYLTNCEFCPRKNELIEKSKKLIYCEAEKKAEKKLMLTGKIPIIEGYLEECICCPLKETLRDRVAYLKASNRDTIKAYDYYLQQYRKGFYSDEARARLEELKPAP